jgi:hypothetical protein
MQVRVLLAYLILAGCGTTPASVDPYQQCQVSSREWQQVEEPSTRESLLSLSEQVSGEPVRKYFALNSDSQREVWFEDSDRHLQLCLYDVLGRSCYGAEIVKVTFTRIGTSWVAGPVMRTICSD